MDSKKRTKKDLINELTELRQRIQELEASETEFKALKDALSIVYDAIDSTVGGVIITNVEGIITYVNPSFLRMFEYKDKSEVLGQNAADLFAAEDIKKFADVKAIIDMAEGETDEFIAQHKNGTEFNVEVSSSNVVNHVGDIVGRMASFVDITKLIKAERLAAAGEMAMAISHHINNPLTVVMGITNLLLDEELSDDLYEKLTRIARNTERIRDVVKKITELKDSKTVDAGTGFQMIDIDSTSEDREGS